MMNLEGGWTLTDGVWIGPEGERLRAISGGQDLLGFASGLEEAFEGASQVPFTEGAGGGGGSGLWDFASKVGGGVGKGWDWLTKGTGQAGQPTQASPLTAFSQALGLGATGLGISSTLSTQKQLAEQTQMLKKGQQTAQAAASPAVAAGTEQLAESRAGKLPAPMEKAVEQWKQQAKADVQARFASMGLGNSSDIQHELARIDLMGESMKAQLLQGQEGLALEALQTGVSAGTGVAQTAAGQQNTLAALIQAANQQLGRLGSTQA